MNYRPKILLIFALLLGLMFYGAIGYAQEKNVTSVEQSKSATQADKTSSSNIYDEIIIKNFPTPSNQSEKDDYDKLVSMLSYDAEKEISSWITWKLFFGVIPIFILLAGALWIIIKGIIENSVKESVKELVKTEIDRSNKFIDNTISSFDKKREQAIEITEKVKLEIDLAQETLKEFRKKEKEINEKLEDFKNEIENKEKEISNLNLNLDSIKEELESKVEAETSRLEQKTKVLRLIIKKIDKSGSSENQVIDELILDLNSDDEKIKYNAVELLPQFEIESSKITDAFVKILKDSPDTTFESLLLSGLSELRGDSTTLAYLLEAVNNLSSPNISAIIGALGKIGESNKTKIKIDKELESAIDKLLSILNDELDSKEFSKEAKIKPSDVRSAITLALSYYGKKAANAENDVIKLLEDQEPETRKNAAIALGKIGSKNAIPVLQKLKNDEYIEVRDAALKAIEEIQERNE